MSLVLKKASEIEQPTHKERVASESNYRRGYWDGVLAACNEIIIGTTQHDVRLWLFRELKEWCHNGHDSATMEYPPKCVRGRSFDEATLLPPSNLPKNSGGKSFVYAISDGCGCVKIGVADNIEKRIRQLQTGNARRLYLVAYLPFETRRDADAVECQAHADPDIERMTGEWFSITDCHALQVLIDAADACGFEMDPIEVEHRVY